MLESLQTAEEMLQAAVVVLASRDDDLLRQALGALPAPIYVTDAEGFLTYFNPACVGFAGRTPAAGKDRWCVSWKLYSEDGQPLPHGECPLAEAIRTRRAVRGIAAIAERPDRTRINFMPLPTPLLDVDGVIIGAVNLLIDITDQRQAGELRRQAVRCRRLAAASNDAQAHDTLTLMAAEYDDKAAELDSPAEPGN